MWKLQLTTEMIEETTPLLFLSSSFMTIPNGRRKRTDERNNLQYRRWRRLSQSLQTSLNIFLLATALIMLLLCFLSISSCASMSPSYLKTIRINPSKHIRCLQKRMRNHGIRLFMFKNLHWYNKLNRNWVYIKHNNNNDYKKMANDQVEMLALGDVHIEWKKNSPMWIKLENLIPEVNFHGTVVGANF